MLECGVALGDVGWMPADDQCCRFLRSPVVGARVPRCRSDVALGQGGVYALPAFLFVVAMGRAVLVVVQASLSLLRTIKNP